MPPWPGRRVISPGTQPERPNQMSVMKKWFPSKYLAADDIKENEVSTIREIKDEAKARALP